MASVLDTKRSRLDCMTRTPEWCETCNSSSPKYSHRVLSAWFRLILGREAGRFPYNRYVRKRVDCRQSGTRGARPHWHLSGYCLVETREREKERRKKQREGSDQGPPCCQIPSFVHSPQIPHPLVLHSGDGQEPLSRLLTYHNLVPSFLPATMSELPDIILKNSDQRALSPKAVAFQVATMAGISVRCPPPSRPTLRNHHTAILVDHHSRFQRPPAK